MIIDLAHGLSLRWHHADVALATAIAGNADNDIITDQGHPRNDDCLNDDKLDVQLEILSHTKSVMCE